MQRRIFKTIFRLARAAFFRFRCYYCAFNIRTLKFKDQRTNTFLAGVKQMCRRLLPSSDYYRARGSQIKSFIRVTQHSRKLGGAAELLIDGSEKSICRLSFEFWVRMLLKGAVKSEDEITVLYSSECCNIFRNQKEWGKLMAKQTTWHLHDGRESRHVG